MRSAGADALRQLDEARRVVATLRAENERLRDSLAHAQRREDALRSAGNEWMARAEAAEAKVERTTWQQDALDEGYRLQIAHAEARLHAAEAKIAAVRRQVDVWKDERYPDTHSPGWNTGYDMRREADVEALLAILDAPTVGRDETGDE